VADLASGPSPAGELAPARAASSFGSVGSREELWSGAIIDCDVHATVPSLQALFPYMDPSWVEWIKERQWSGPSGVAVVYPPNAPASTRPEWSPPATDVTALRDALLDPWRTERAVINCYYAVDSIRHPDCAAAVAAAVNNWLIAEWLDRDASLAASIVIPARDPQAAVAEIERVGAHPQFVQVLAPIKADRLYGSRSWHPVFDAMRRHDLVLGLHFGGATDDAPTPTGWPSWYVEEYVGEWGNFSAQLTNLLAEGVFSAFPDARVAVLEAGFVWVPSLGWRMNKEWKGLRREVPWIDRLPTTLLREHVRFSTSPIDAGPSEELANIVQWLGSDEQLMFATDYPHMHDDDVRQLLGVLEPDAQTKLMAENARGWYRL
jgi:predicted TIM-barrel fold metal-dependent hydrolase